MKGKTVGRLYLQDPDPLLNLELHKLRDVGLKTGLFRLGKGIRGGEHLIAAGALVKVQSQTIAIQ